MRDGCRSCCSTAGAGGIDRRELLRAAGAGAVALLSARGPVAAAPLQATDFEQLVPADKKLHPDWVRSLFERGAPTVHRGAELEKIGMPVGGLCAGQLYLGGDGKLWHWDIFNRHHDTGSSGPHYASPMQPAAPLEQGFALQVTSGGRTGTWALDRSGFSDVSFCGEYPIGTVEYRDPASPLSVTLEAFSPFIPLNTDDSSLPATVLRFTLRNTSKETLAVTLAGWLENAVCLHNRGQPGTRRNRIERKKGLTFLDCTVERSAIAAPSERLAEAAPLEGLFDYGTMGLALMGDPADHALAAAEKGGFSGRGGQDASVALDEVLIGALGRKLRLRPGRSATVEFVLAWHFPNLELQGLGKVGRHYASRFDSAKAVARYVAEHFDRLTSETRHWRDTWYDSTLPYWFLDRTFQNTSILATSTAFRFASGRFYGWEGVGCCAGTCTHVWHYAHAPARLFPDFERSARERADFGVAFDPATGRIRFRAEHNNHWAVDGQAGCILRAYREHQMSADDSFLRRLWPRVKKSLEFLIIRDEGQDGIIDGPQHNTLDADWFGQVAWLSSLYVAALRAGEAMARELGDDEFAVKARAIADAGSRNIDQKLFNGEYYVQLPDRDHPRSVGSYDGCEIDQVFGQSWAHQVGLGRLLSEAHVKSALGSLWKYNFTPDVGPYREAHKPGRWYAMAGEAGLLMCAWPRGEGARIQQGFDYYFNECMTGFEYQAAGHMIWEGMLLEGLAVTRAVHDRYHASRRNSWNEIECGDHYARAMASYGVFLAACGFEYHGPKCHLGFAPRLAPEKFKAAFTGAEGWGSFAQQAEGGRLRAQVALRWGRLRLKTLALALPAGARGRSVRMTLDGRAVRATSATIDSRLLITLAAELALKAGQKLEVRLG